MTLKNPRPKPNPRLPRDEIVEIITNFYTLLTDLYIPASSLKIPPPGGWPTITPEATKDSGKSALVIDILKYLPYIDETQAREMRTHIHYKCDVVDDSEYHLKEGRFGRECMDSGAEFLVWDLEERETQNGEDEEDEEEEEDIYDEEDHDGWWDRNLDPEKIELQNLVVLAEGYESGGRTFVLDVFQGIIHEDMIRCQRLGSTEVEHFFADLQDKFERLELVPVPGHGSEEGELFEDVSEIGEDEVLVDPLKGGGDGGGWRSIDHKWFKKIYREHGWPSEGYRKEEALATIRRYTSQEEE
jgi:hypothetical protein